MNDNNQNFDIYVLTTNKYITHTCQEDDHALHWIQNF